MNRSLVWNENGGEEWYTILKSILFEKNVLFVLLEEEEACSKTYLMNIGSIKESIRYM